VCATDIRYRQSNHRDNGSCIFQTLALIFGALMTAAFWCAISVNSFIAIFLKKDHWFKYPFAQPLTHALCWGIPTLCCLIGLSMDRIGGTQVIQFCFLFDRFTTDSRLPTFSIQFPLFFIPIGVFLVLALFSIIMVLFEMRNIGSSQGEFRYSKHVRLALFLVVFWILYAFAFAYRIVNSLSQDRWATLATAWSQAAISDPNAPRPGGGPSIVMQYLFHFVASAQGFIISLLFGSSREVLDFWRDRINNVREGRSFLAGMSTGFTSEGQKGVSSIRNTGPQDAAVFDQFAK